MYNEQIETKLIHLFSILDRHKKTKHYNYCFDFETAKTYVM